MSPTRSRRRFLVSAGALVAASCNGPAPRKPEPAKPAPRRPRILVLPGGQAGGDGVVASTAGLLRLLATYLPEAEVSLRREGIPKRAADLLRLSFPEVRLRADGAGTPEDADLLLHGSASEVAVRFLAGWRKRTAKPYGMFGISFPLSAGALDAGPRGVLEGASFIFTRETRSLENLQKAGVKPARMGFAPDAAFSLKMSDDAGALAFLKRRKLETKRFLALAPGAGAGQELLRQAGEAWARQSGQRVLARPESSWLPDLASSVFRRAYALVSLDCRASIIAAVNDTPPVNLLAPGDVLEGQVWKDIGLGRWTLEAEKTSVKELVSALEHVRQDYPAAQVDTHEAVTYARKLQSDAMDAVRKATLAGVE